MIDGIIDGTIQLLVRDVRGLPRAPIQEFLEFLSDRGAIAGRRDLLRRDGHNADFLVGVDGAAQELLDGGLQALREVAGFLARDISHGGYFLQYDRTKLRVYGLLQTVVA
jgi:hypothetical protein